MKFYIVRHGETLFNVKHLMQGWCDSPLTENGIQQAKNTGKKLENVDFVYAYSSTSERAVDTLTYILGNRNIDRCAIKEVKEINFGSLEGEPQESAHAEQEEVDHDMTKFGGEQREDAGKRLYNALLSLSKKHPEGNVLVVSHGGIIINLLLMLDKEYVENLFKQGKFIDNGSISVFECDGTTLEFKGMME